MKPANWIVYAALAAGQLPAQVSYQRLVQSAAEPQNWLTYSGSYKSWRYSPLNQINRQNASRLKLAWVHQMVTSIPFASLRRQSPARCRPVLSDHPAK